MTVAKVVPAQGWCVVSIMESATGVRLLTACWPVVAWAVDEEQAGEPATAITPWGSGIVKSAHHHSGACSPVWKFAEDLDCFDALHQVQLREREGRAGR